MSFYAIEEAGKLQAAPSLFVNLDSPCEPLTPSLSPSDGERVAEGRVRIPRGGRSRIGPLNPIIRPLGSLAPAEGERVGVRGLSGRLRFMGRGFGGERHERPPRGMVILLFWMMGLAGALAQNYTIDWWAISGGGGTSTGGVYTVSGTIGQPATATLSGGNYSLQGGFWGIIAAVQTPGAPYLSVTRSNAAVVISWPGTDPSWKLHWTASLAAPASWTELPPPYATNGADSVFVEPAPTGNRYYQLHKP